MPTSRKAGAAICPSGNLYCGAGRWLCRDQSAGLCRPGGRLRIWAGCRVVFPAIVLGIFQKGMNKQGAIAGMLAGFLFTAGYIIYFKSLNPAMDNAQDWLLGSHRGYRHVRNPDQSHSRLAGGLFNTRTPEDVQAIVEEIRLPGEAIQR